MRWASPVDGERRERKRVEKGDERGGEGWGGVDRHGGWHWVSFSIACSGIFVDAGHVRNRAVRSRLRLMLQRREARPAFQRTTTAFGRARGHTLFSGVASVSLAGAYG